MNENDESKLAASIARLESSVAQLEARLTAQGPPDYQQNRRTRFQENGNWARHYSTVRMTTTTFLVGVSLGVLSFKWSPPAHPQIAFIALAGGVWMMAVLLFLVFTRFTYQEMERARLRRRELPDGGVSDVDKRFHQRQDAASWIVSALTVFYGALLLHLGDIRMWPPYFTLDPSFMMALGCGIPGAVIGLGILAAWATGWRSSN